MIRKPKGPTAKRRAAKKRESDSEYAWHQKNRRMVIERDVWCRWCQRFGNEVHHIRPRSLCVDHSTSNLVLLCGLCHAKIHGKSLRVSGNADSLLTFEVLK